MRLYILYIYTSKKIRYNIKYWTECQERAKAVDTLAGR